MTTIGKWTIILEQTEENEMTAFRSEDEETLLIVDREHDKMATLMVEEDESLVILHLSFDKIITVNHKTHTATISANPAYADDEYGIDDED
ncbi:hypothetical protein [Bacillus massiliigorillae]|uniref:hypothetical protein n=1 Tax=Bacillus massiliigorillae TaxID=1243664 RepID=UPI00039DA6B0|nr:hypothetical protein [Bacillus massiliigorillae]